MSRRDIYCAGCSKEVAARLTDGAEIYPHRYDLADLPFWRCDDCGGYIGCHHKTKNPTAPLGCIPTPAMRAARRRLHAVLDPVWKRGHLPRQEVYRRMAELTGWNFHTGLTRSLEEVERGIDAARIIARPYD